MVRRLRPLLLIASITASAALGLDVPARRSRRRFIRALDDVGDDWRSLLLGAPPAVA